MPLFWRFLEIKNLHYNLDFSTFKATLSFVFALQFLILQIEVSNNEV